LILSANFPTINNDYQTSRMNITSNFEFDLPTPKPEPGSYEWWYFDAIDATGIWQLVVIFYEGCPFSPLYNNEWASNNNAALASKHPAISISVYKKGKPVFYSMSEYPEIQSRFDISQNNQQVNIQIGDNELILTKDGEHLSHELQINELLPSGDALSGVVIFQSDYNTHLFPLMKQEGSHFWNLTQPRAKVHVNLELNTGNGSHESLNWIGNGYHDHNLGCEPMMNTFTDWYWGRAHFKNHTLIYYLMKKHEILDFKGWLLDDKQSIIDIFQSGRLNGKISNVFMLDCAETLSLKGKKAKVEINQRQLLDSGPFYYRFKSDFELHLNGWKESCEGISEYIYPSRIHQKRYWPLVHMRYRYVQNPHWVQKSSLLYPLTW